ncbi:MAG: TolC family protein [Bacteroidota bacterium]|nr:TolC family protein [Bacteroidota bacterium]
MKKYTLIPILMIFICSVTITAQEVITLTLCYENAAKNHPQAGAKQMHQNLWQLKQDNLTASWYPEIEAGANALYNSNVVDMSEAFESIPVPGITENIPLMPHDQYKLTIDINQVIYDGGAIKGKRQLEDAGLELNKEEVEVELYKTRKQVNDYYFAFILLHKQKEQLSIYLQTITEQILSLESGIRNGVLLPSDRDVLKAEKIRLEQQIAETEIRINSTATVLSDLTGMEINHDTKASVPEPVISRSTGLSRPELNVLDLKKQHLEAGRALIKSERKPKAFAFASLGYGRPPGNDFFTETFGPYYIIGAGIKWKILDWKKNHRQEEIIDINKSIIGSHRKNLQENLSRALEMKNAEIRSLESALENDEELISTLKSVRQTALSQYNNGTITASEYITEWSKEKEAVISREIHAVSLAKAQVEYLNIAGKEIK